MEKGRVCVLPLQWQRIGKQPGEDKKVKWWKKVTESVLLLIRLGRIGCVSLLYVCPGGGGVKFHTNSPLLS